MPDRASLPDAQAEGSQFVRTLVRQGDRDRYWSALLAPEPARTTLLALYAFNLELTRIADEVSEPAIGLIRLKWWHDAVSGTEGGAAHPVLAALLAGADRDGLPRAALAGMIEAREAELDADGFASFEDLERYFEATAGAVFALGAGTLAKYHTSGVADLIKPLARDAAVACGLAGLMRALPWHASRGKVFLPQSLLAAHGLHPDTIRAGNENPDLRAALRDVGKRAEDALARFRLAAQTLPRELRPAFLPVAIAAPCLRELARPGRAPFSDPVQLNPLRRYLLIWRAYLTGRF